MNLAQLANGTYRFTTDSEKEIILTEYELLGLFRLSADYQDQLKSQGESHQPYPQPTTRIAKIQVGLDAHHTEVIVRYAYKQGGETAYVISPEDATGGMRDGLTIKLEQIAAAKRGRTRN